MKPDVKRALLKGRQGRNYVSTQLAKFATGKSIVDFHTIRIRANLERIRNISTFG